ncbi:MAG: 4-hydroxy-tetrahydrodipicolinate reductase [Candidatus Omnitrophica bacterium]|nr:4-hydroxy-tetrahydrodipicolinate reductase [Candidatus Omnitrophota bacterium]
MKVKLIISGCLGKMGRRIAEAASQDRSVEIIAGIEKESFVKNISRPISNQNLGFPVTADLKDYIRKADVVIEFTEPAVTLNHLDIVSRFKKKMVIGTTGFKDEDAKYIRKISGNIPLLLSPNMSIGVNVLFKIAPQLTSLLGNDYDIEIIELHHNRKKDAPSGTAVRIADLIKQARKELKIIYGRHGAESRRSKDELAIHALRLGDITGEHKIIFAGNDEVIEFTHKALSRDIFARGALLAAKYINKKKKSGLYTMQDVLAK